MRFRCFLFVTGLALLLGPTAGKSQFGGQPGDSGGRGGGFGATDPDQRWNQYTGGKAVWKRAEITDPNMVSRFDRIAQMVGATNGEITKDQYVRLMRERVAQGGTAAAGSAATAASPGPRWEYKVQTREGIAEVGKNDFAAGLNKLGDDGWELVAVPGVEPGRGFGAARRAEYYFKRPEGVAAREQTTAAEDEYQILRLKFAQATDLAGTLQELFHGKGGGPALVADPRTNTLVIRGAQKQVQLVRDIARELDVPGAEDAGRPKKP